MAEWTQYGFTIPGGKLAGGPDCAQLEEVYHVAHIADARRIIEDGQLTARLIYDESKLNQTRLNVCWASANKWNDGSIYGTVEFAFRWADLVKDRQIYWVEVMTDYSPHAYRFLLTHRPLDHLTHVTAYNPKTDDGPLRQRGNDWFWNRNYTAEFMIDVDISIGLCKRLTFIGHNQRLCRLFKSSCKERKQNWNETAARILGYIIGTGVTTVNEALMPDIGPPAGRRSTTMIHAGVGRLWQNLGGSKPESFCGPIITASSAMYIVRGALLQYAFTGKVEACGMVSALESSELFETALLSLVREHFNLPNFEFDGPHSYDIG